MGFFAFNQSLSLRSSESKMSGDQMPLSEYYTHFFGFRWIKPLLFALPLLLLSSCTFFIPKVAGIGDVVEWNDLPGWEKDNHAESWPALLSQCSKLAKKQATWGILCEKAALFKDPTDEEARTFFETYFLPHEVVGKGGNSEGLITGYYEPTLFGSMQPDKRYAYPIYSRPDSLLVIELSDLFPSLKGKRVRGRIIGNKVVPYFDRSEIDGSKQPLKGNELLWIDDPYGSFFLQIQGSGRINMPDGSQVGVGYGDQNGHQYFAIGKKLIELGELTREEVSLFTIRQWLKVHPDKAMNLLNHNPSYVFFVLNEDVQAGPRGSLNVPLTAERSAAVDRSVIPLGTPLWLSSTLPGNETHPYQRLIFAQDTGGAITGPVRADLFFGHGERAEQLAGTMKQAGRLFALLPK